MPKKAATMISPHSDQKDVAAYINRAFDTGDLDDICKAIGIAAKRTAFLTLQKNLE